MKRLLLILIMSLGLSACAKYEQFDLRPVSFEIDGKMYYSAKDMRTVNGNIFNIPDPVTMVVNEVEGRLEITYRRDSDFINHDLSCLYLNIKGAKGKFVTGEKISFDISDELETYPSVWLSPVKTSSASESDLYRAVRGWIEFDDIVYSEKTVTGRFEFDAVLEDETECDHKKEIKVRKGTFENIPFTLLPTQDPAEL